MNLKTLRIEGLYGTFNHEINFTSKDNIDIILGQNGIGKTTILRIIDMVFNQKLCSLTDLYFMKASFYLDNDVTFFIEAVEDSRGAISDYYVCPPQHDAGFLCSDLLEKVKKHVRDSKDFILCDFRNEYDLWIDKKDGRYYTGEEVLWYEKKEMPGVIDEFLTVYPSWFEEIIKENSVKFIQTQRLQTQIGNIERTFVRRTSDFQNTLKVYSEECKKRMQDLSSKYADKASELDQAYPYKLVGNIESDCNLKWTEVETSIEEIEAKRKRLENAGLMDKTKWEIQKLKKSTNSPYALRAIDLYIQDSRTKFEIFDEELRRIELFLDLVNSRLLKKHVLVRKNIGLTAVSDVTEKDIPLEKLSSGEQHLIILYFDLIFRMEPYTLIMIDEPEISLHVAWQKRFIGEMKKITALNKASLLIATHSPTLIGRYWNLTQELDNNL